MKLDKDKLSRIERGVQPLDTTEAAAIASVDPLQRGAAWLAWGSGFQGASGASSNMDGRTPRTGGTFLPREGEEEDDQRKGGTG